MIDTDKHKGVRTPFGFIPMEDILEMLEPIRERDKKIAELNAEIKRLREGIKAFIQPGLDLGIETPALQELIE